MSCRTIPWLWLTFCFLWYACASFVLAYTPLWVKAIALAEVIAQSPAPSQAMAVTGLIALVWTGVLPLAWAVVEAGSGAMPATKTIAGVAVVVVAGIGVMVLAGAGTWAYALAWSGAWASAASGGGAWTLTRILARTVILAWASCLACGALLGVLVWNLPWAESWVEILVWFLVEAWACALLLGVVGALALTWAVVEDQLPKSLSQFQTFLILALTSLLGMGLGWLANLVCRF
mgnify:CR=1 FL=1